MSAVAKPFALPGTHVHIVAIGGVMMSAIARLLHQQGCVVSGSDLVRSEYTEALRAEGISVTVGPHTADNLPPRAKLVAISSAVKDDNPEVVAARERGLPVLKRAEVLGQVVNARDGIAVAGTHGKTTTSGLIATMLTEAGGDPTFLVGSVVRNYGTNCRVGQSDWVVVEADEYDRAFLSLEPRLALIANVENDHPDVYTDFNDVVETFRTFVSQVREDGLLLLGSDCAVARELADAARCRVETFGLNDSAQWRATAWQVDPKGQVTFDLTSPGGQKVVVPTSLYGRHNVINAAGAVAAAVGAGLTVDQAAGAVAAYQGTARRFEVLAEAGGIRVIDDYAHHPTEVQATIAAAAALGDRLRVVFEPHQFARTRALINDYRGVFAQADETLVTDIYVARETDLTGVSSAQLAEVAGGEAAGVHYVGSPAAARERLVSNTGARETWLVMGAGTITSLAHDLAEWVRSRHDA